MTSAPHNPVKDATETPALRHALETACAARGLSVSGATLMHHYSNAVYHLPAERAAARVTHGGDIERACQVQAVVGWLNEHAAVAVTAPLPGAEAVAIDGTTTVSFWEYYPQPDGGPDFTSAHLAGVLRDLHGITDVPFELERWRPLASLAAALEEAVHTQALPADELSWLTGLVADVRNRVTALDSPLGHGVIHGDAWAGNLLWNTAAGPDATVLGDWDWVSIGPREVDLVPTWHAARRYGRGREWTDDFARVYGHDLAGWDGFETLLLMRDLMQITGPLRRVRDSPVFAEVLRERLSGVRAGTSGGWRGL
ncbi:phosphotransferase [Longispora sp. K20-0274]|uniref:phosphotransferase n=1 Tax=Longispora sp. K20-0274 TaxID=3088255 RepID=UPI00399A866C